MFLMNKIKMQYLHDMFPLFQMDINSNASGDEEVFDDSNGGGGAAGGGSPKTPPPTAKQQREAAKRAREAKALKTRNSDRWWLSQMVWPTDEAFKAFVEEVGWMGALDRAQFVGSILSKGGKAVLKVVALWDNYKTFVSKPYWL